MTLSTLSRQHPAGSPPDANDTPVIILLQFGKNFLFPQDISHDPHERLAN